MRSVLTLAATVFLVSQAVAAPTSRSECSSPPMRREWRHLSSTEQAAFITAVKLLSNSTLHPHSPNLNATNFTPGIVSINPSSSRYDDFVYAHMDTNIKDHFTGLFLPWHRWYLYAFEKALREECGYTGYLPYWNWSLDTNNVAASPIFNSDPATGLGTFGVPADNYTVHDGAFATVTRAYPTPHYVERNMTLYPFKNKVFPFAFENPDMKATDAFTPTQVHNITHSFPGNFVGFAAYMDGWRAQGMHNAAHLQFMPGDMSNPSYSPNDIIFFLHHANLDRIWAKWQNQSAANAAAYGGGSVQDLSDYDNHPVGKEPNLDKNSTIWTSGLGSPSLVVADVMSTKGGILCYHYNDTDITP
ncbi:tyrosinase [Ceratobasidium sp. AG-Ba]|nr:tyrosinase [Ceratobasidium sp. AG-Ba]